MKYDITLLTPTGGRPYQMRLCEIYRHRQKTKLNIQWIIVDDTKETSGVDYKCDVIVSRKPFWQQGENTLGKNILEGLRFVESDIVLFWEDDDWYSPEYVQFYYDNLQDCNLFGQGHAHYYNVVTGGYKIWNNDKHASLCQTGIKTQALLDKSSLFRRDDCPFYDLYLWGDKALKNKKIDTESQPYCIGIKGVAGRGGLGSGHRDKTYKEYDADRSMLANWIGDDWRKYDVFFQENQHDRA
jgi:hypothetical protein